MIKKGILLFGLGAFMFSSCIEHEVIPAPVPTVDLSCHFFGEVNGAEVELTENVLGYTNYGTKTQILVQGGLSSAIYFSEMASTSILTSVKVGLGSINWDANVSPEPSVSSFNGFILSNASPNYSDDGTVGFEFTFKDGQGRIWESHENSPIPQEVEFTNIVQESDESGDYSLFQCDFHCYVYSLNPDSLALQVPVVHMDSMNVQNAVYQGWFKR
jgi:hypothetical protein